MIADLVELDTGLGSFSQISLPHRSQFEGSDHLEMCIRRVMYCNLSAPMLIIHMHLMRQPT